MPKVKNGEQNIEKVGRTKEVYKEIELMQPRPQGIHMPKCTAIDRIYFSLLLSVI